MALLQIILNLQMRLILKASANQRYKNLLISNKVAIIILDKYGNTSFCDIMLIERYAPNKRLRYYYINLTYAAYMPLHYMLLFLAVILASTRVSSYTTLIKPASKTV